MNKQFVVVSLVALSVLAYMGFANGLFDSSQPSNSEAGLVFTCSQNDVALSFEEGLALKESAEQRYQISAVLANHSDRVRGFQLISSCGCATVLPSSGTLEPGQELPIKFLVNVKPAGNTQTFTVDVIDNGKPLPDQERFAVTWNSLFFLDYVNIDWKKDQKSLTVPLGSISSFSSVNDITVHCDADWVRSELLKNEAKKTYELHLEQIAGQALNQATALLSLVDRKTELKCNINLLRQERALFAQPGLIIRNPKKKEPDKFRVVVMGTKEFPNIEKVEGLKRNELTQVREFVFENSVCREFEIAPGVKPKKIILTVEEFGQCSVSFVTPISTKAERFNVPAKIKQISEALRSTERILTPTSWECVREYLVHTEEKDEDFPQGLVKSKTSKFLAYRHPDGKEISKREMAIKLFSGKDGNDFCLQVYDGKATKVRWKGKPARSVKGRLHSYQSRDFSALCLDNLNQSSLRTLADIVSPSTKEWDLKWDDPVVVFEDKKMVLFLNAHIKIKEYDLPRRIEVKLFPENNYALKSVEYFSPSQEGDGEKVFTSTVVKDYLTHNGLQIPHRVLETSFNVKTGKKATTRRYQLKSVKAISENEFTQIQKDLLATASSVEKE